MMHCNDCGETFWEDDVRTVTISEQYEVWGTNIIHDYIEEYCPYCGSEDIEKSKEDKAC